jgi:predicted ATP-grasp superfamily ATP-dependent carboligase
MRAIVLDGNENQAVAATRSLGRAGVSVVVGDSTAWSKAGWSRFASRSFQYVAPQEDATRFVEDVARLAAEMPGTVVMPMTERTTIPISERRELLDRAGARYVLPPHATLLRAMNKQQTTALAASLGVATPATEVLHNEEEAGRFARAARYPVVLKPASSEEDDGHGAMRATGKPLYARSAAEFTNAFRTLSARCSTLLAQEYVEGRGVGYFALMNRGKLRAEFAHRRIRDVRPTGSGSALRESVAVDPRVRSAALPLLESLEWHGVAMVEFRLRADGVPVFLEVNGRFWNSLALPVIAGVDFPALLFRLATATDVEPVHDYRVGVRCRWWLGDVRHLMAVLRGRPAEFQGYFPGRLETIGKFFTPVPGTHHDNFRWDDPLPELGDWLDFGTRRIPRALHASRAQ